MLRLCADFPEPESPPAPHTVWAYDCAHLHLTDVLRSVTNQDAGMWCSEWRTWLRQNRGKSWNLWIRDGFAQDGITLTIPPTPESFRAVVSSMADDRQWRRIAAWRVLSQLSRAELDRRLAALSDVRDPVVRLGMERVRSKLQGER